LIARRPPAGGPAGERILLASDAGERSDDLVGLGITLAISRGSELLVLHVAHAESSFQPTRIAQQAARVADALGERGRVEVLDGRPKDLVVEAAAREHASLVVVASRRTAGVRALGSVSERVVHDAPCSVLVVRPEDLPG
ncbi:MAG: universal stress protein, partial [Acidobacteriota bacterium]|nr:universal stress protein [Acidobacteriota bacterium]